MVKILILAFILFPSLLHAASLTLTWTDNSNNETGFKVERKTGQTGAFTEIGQTAANVTTLVDPVPDGQLYCYRVNAFNSAGSSPWSAEACGTTLTVPLAPGAVTITITVTP